MTRQLFIVSCFVVSVLRAGVAVADSPIQPGDRIAIVGNTFADQLRIHGYLETMLLGHTANHPVSIRNLGWGGDMLSARDRPTGFPTEESTLMAHRTDVIIACFGMGESFAGKEGLEDFRRRLSTFIESHAGKRYNGRSEVRLILVSPIACEDLGRLTPARDQRNQELQAYALAMRDVASDANVHFVDLFEASRYLMDETVGPQLTTNGIHLNAYGYWAISHAFFSQLVAQGQFSQQASWQLRIDAETLSNEARGVRVLGLSADGAGLRFRVRETSAPALGPPTEVQLPPQLAYVRDNLIVDNLPSGTYRLTIDEQPMVVATSDSWAQGVAIDMSPAHQEAERFRGAVNDKNQQFNYSWKALNQVHIVGERKTSPSGQKLPQEIIEFRKLADEREAGLQESMELKTRQWRILPVEE